MSTHEGLRDPPLQGPIERLDLPRPEPGPDDLLVRVRAASVNPLDLKIQSGGVKVVTPYQMPLVLGNDLSGVVEAVGAQVTRFKTGDAVYARLDTDRIGAFAEWALVRQKAAALKPVCLDYRQATSLPLVGLTAWQALVDIAQLEPGMKVLIHAGSGGVGTIAIQLAKHLGAKVATTASARNHELVHSLGADLAIDYKTTRFEEMARDQDIVFDTQGGETLLRSFDAVRAGGVVVTVGGRPDGKWARGWGLSLPLVWVLTLLARPITQRAKRRRVRFEYLFMHASGEELDQISTLVEKGAIRPVLDRTFPFDQTAEAVAYTASGRAVGKVVIDVATTSPAPR
jgi:alcohol dehydrogenase